MTDMQEKYKEFHQAIGDTVLASRLFTVALNLAEHRRGGLFVVLDQEAGRIKLGGAGRPARKSGAGLL